MRAPAALGDTPAVADEALHGARCLRAAVHGFVSLESAGGLGLPLDLDASCDPLVRVLTTGLRAEVVSATS